MMASSPWASAGLCFSFSDIWEYTDTSTSYGVRDGSLNICQKQYHEIETNKWRSKQGKFNAQAFPLPVTIMKNCFR